MASTNEAPPARAQRSAGRESSWITTLGALLFVAALVLLTAKLLRKGMPSLSVSLPDEVVEVLGRKPLDGRHTLHVVRCGSRLLLLGSSHEGLQTLTELTSRDEVDRLASLCRTSEKGPVSAVGDLWNRWRGEATHDNDSSAADVDELPKEDRSDVSRAGARLALRVESPTLRSASASGPYKEDAA